MFVKDIMQTKVITISPKDTAKTARELMDKHQIRHLPVVEGKKLIGVVTDRDVRHSLASKLVSVEVKEIIELLDNLKIEGIMTRDPFTVTPLTPIAEAAEMLVEKKIGCLPVVSRGELVGIITDRDILLAFARMTDKRPKG